MSPDGAVLVEAKPRDSRLAMRTSSSRHSKSMSLQTGCVTRRKWQICNSSLDAKASTVVYTYDTGQLHRCAPQSLGKKLLIMHRYSDQRGLICDAIRLCLHGLEGKHTRMLRVPSTAPRAMGTKEALDPRTRPSAEMSTWLRNSMSWALATIAA